MPSTRQIKSRIKSVKSNKQITKAMELIAASKLRKAQEAALKTRDYADMARDILSSLSTVSDIAKHPMFQKREIKSRLVILVTSDRGLAGAYNSNVHRIFTKQLKADSESGVMTKVITIGKKSARFTAKLQNCESVGAYPSSDKLKQSDIRPIVQTVSDAFADQSIDTVELIGTKFVNSFTQTAYMQTLLPAGIETLNDPSDESDPRQHRDMKFEPNTEEVLNYVLIKLIEAQLFQTLLDSNASEQAMRRVAMKNASDNASDIVDDLTLEMNKVRQAAITQELSEISAGAESLK